MKLTERTLRRLIREEIKKENLLTEVKAQIGYIDKSGRIVSTFVYNDGWVTGVGIIAKRYYDGKKVKKLLAIDKGTGIVSLKPNVDDTIPPAKEWSLKRPGLDKDETVFLGRDRAVKGGKFMKGTLDNFDKYLKKMESGVEYVYLYNEKDGKWYYSETRGPDVGLEEI
jgi:hypothetical protein